MVCICLPIIYTILHVVLFKLTEGGVLVMNDQSLFYFILTTPQLDLLPVAQPT